MMLATSVDVKYEWCYKSHPPIRPYKGKAVPLQAWTGPEGSRKLRLPDFVTRAQDGGNTLIWRDKFTSFQKRERTLGK